MGRDLSHAVGLGFALFVVSSLPAQDDGNSKPAPIPIVAIPVIAQEKAALRAVGVRTAGAEAHLSRIDDSPYRVSVESAIRDFKHRVAVLQMRFDPALYETLMHSVISRYR